MYPVDQPNLTAKIRQNYGGQRLLFESIPNSSWFFAELEGPIDERRNKAHGEQSVGLNGLSNRSPAP